MDIGKIQPREITEEMRESYLDYAMSVIVARALPDVRDGLKPVQRRILYSMQEMGLGPRAKYQKSAKVVGHAMGNYHPHSDSAIYDSLARMAQDFTLRYPLVDGQGNFGSMDGDAPAAMRYTEARLARIADELLADIDKETVAWNDNYDGSRKEPAVLPSRIPQLLLNGSVGIAVGMATNIPPHNLGELVDGLTHLIDKPDTTTEDLVRLVRGPDFPTGGTIYNRKDILQAYATGKGPIVMRGAAEVVESTSHKGLQILITEIPFQVNKATLLENIADLVKNKRLEGIKDIRDESDKEGVRVAIDLRPDAQPQKILNQLYKTTDLQKTFHVNMLALVDGFQPQVLSLKSMLEQYLAHRKEVVERRTRYELRRAEERAHILEGLSKALEHIERVIETIKKSATKEEAHGKLVKKFALSDLQAGAILEMRLSTLAGLEQKKIHDELKEKREIIAYLTDLLKSEKKLWQVVKSELIELKNTYPGERRTKIHAGALGEFQEEDLVAQEEVIITLSREGFIKRLSPDAWQAQRRGGQGKTGAKLSEEDFIEHLIVASSHDDISFFTSSGKVFKTRAYEIPPASRTAKGRALVNFLDIGGTEVITAMLALPVAQEKTRPAGAERGGAGAQFLVMATLGGIIKKTPIEDFANVRRNGLIALNLHKGDALRWVKSSTGSDEVFLSSSHGQAIRFSERDVRAMGRTAAGVVGMRLRKGDYLSGMDVIAPSREGLEARVLVLLSKGFGKRTPLKSYKRQRRGGIGIKTANVGAKTGQVVATRILEGAATDLIAISKKGQLIRTRLSEISEMGRATQGVRVMRLREGDEIASIITL
jgi:DNA gyrase subunit A